MYLISGQWGAGARRSRAGGFEVRFNSSGSISHNGRQLAAWFARSNSSHGVGAAGGHLENYRLPDASPGHPSGSQRALSDRALVRVRTVESGRTHCHLRPRRTGAGSGRNSRAAGPIAIELGAAQESVEFHRGSRVRGSVHGQSSQVRGTRRRPSGHRNRHPPSVGRRRVPVPVSGGGSRIAGPLIVRGERGKTPEPRPQGLPPGRDCAAVRAPSRKGARTGGGQIRNRASRKRAGRRRRRRRVRIPLCRGAGKVVVRVPGQDVPPGG